MIELASILMPGAIASVVILLGAPPLLAASKAKTTLRRWASFRWRLFLSWGAIFVAFGALGNVAIAADTVITFDDVPPNTEVATHYHAQGVDFGFPPYAALPPTSQIPGAVLCCLPLTRVSPSGHTSQVADIALSGTEIWTAALFGTFTTSRARVRVTVGDFLPGETAHVSLTAYDKNGALVAQSASQAVTGSGGAVMLTATAPGATPPIFYFLIQSAETNKHLWVDDLTFDNPTTLGPPDFLIAVQGLPNFSTFFVTQGGSTISPLPLSRFNGSNGNIALAASGLPPGVAATFTPNPVPGIETAPQMKLAADKGVSAIQSAPFIVTATPASPSVGPGPHSAQFALSVSPAIGIGFGGGSFDVGACTLLTIGPVDVTRDPAVVPDALVLSLRLHNPDGTTGDLPQGIHASFTPPTSQAPGTLNTLAVSLDPGSLGAAGQLTFEIQASGGVWTAHSLPFVIRGGGSGITSITSSGAIPNAILNQPGSEILIDGFGFCPGTRVEFGNKDAIADGESVSITPTQIKTSVPRYPCASDEYPFGNLLGDSSRAHQATMTSRCADR